MSVKNKGRVDCGLHAVHEPSEQRRLAGSRLAGNDDKALAGLDTITQGGKSFPIVRINIRKSRIGIDAKGQLCKSKMFTVHTWRETYRVNSRVARTICPVVARWFSSLRRHRLWAREKAVDCLENLCQTVGKTFRARERSAVGTVKFFIAIVCHLRRVLRCKQHDFEVGHLADALRKLGDRLQRLEGFGGQFRGERAAFSILNEIGQPYPIIGSLNLKIIRDENRFSG